MKRNGEESESLGAVVGFLRCLCFAQWVPILIQRIPLAHSRVSSKKAAFSYALRRISEGMDTLV